MTNGEREDHPAPGRLAVIQDLANSFDVRRGRDDLATRDDAARWLHEHGIAGSAKPLTADDLATFHELRAALRGLLLANNGQENRGEDLAVVDRVVRDSGLRPRLGPNGQVEVEVPAGGFLASLAWIVAIVLEAAFAGTWNRLKACPEDACNYPFYDRSKNRSRTWCAMARCGSRVKMRSYRARRLDRGPASAAAQRR